MWFSATRSVEDGFHIAVGEQVGHGDRLALGRAQAVADFEFGGGDPAFAGDVERVVEGWAEDFQRGVRLWTRQVSRGGARSIAM